MKTPKVRLYIRIRRIDGADAFVDPAWNRNRTLRGGFAVVNGQPEQHSEGIYYLRYKCDGTVTSVPATGLRVSEMAQLDRSTIVKGRKDEHPALLLAERKQRMSAGAMQERLAHWCRVAGVDHINVHRLRHTFATSLANAERDILQLKNYSGTLRSRPPCSEAAAGLGRKCWAGRRSVESAAPSVGEAACSDPLAGADIFLSW